MIVRGVGRPPQDRYGRPWRFLSKGSAVSAGIATNVPATPATAVCLSSGIQIKLLANQALWLKRYMSSIAQILNDRTLFVFAAEFAYQVAPFTLASSPIVYPASEMMAEASAGATTGQQVGAVGVNFALFDDWLEFDDILLTSPSSLLPGPIQLQSAYQVFNTNAAIRTATVGEMANWEIWESILQ